MGYGSEAIIAAELIAAEEAAAVAAAEAAAAAAASEGAGAAAMAGSGAAASGAGYGAGAAAAGTGAAITSEELAAAQIAQEMGASGGMLGESGAGGLLADPSSALAEGGGNAFVSDWDKYLTYGKEGFRTLGKGVNKMPPGSSNMMMQGLLGGGGGPQTNISPPRPQGQPQQQGSLVSNQPMPTVTPYAQSLGEDAEEMKRRKWLMMQMQGRA